MNNLLCKLRIDKCLSKNQLILIVIEIKIIENKYCKANPSFPFFINFVRRYLYRIVIGRREKQNETKP